MYNNNMSMILEYFKKSSALHLSGPTVRKVKEMKELLMFPENLTYNGTSGTKRDDKETKEKHPH